MENKKGIYSFLQKNARLFWAFLFAILSLLLSRFLYFDSHPLFRFHFIGEGLVATSFFFFTFYLGRTIIFSIGHWFEMVIINSVRKATSEVWATQVQNNGVVNNNDSAKVKDVKEFDAHDFEYLVNGTILDTSAIIDGRILGVIATGFLDTMIIVPQNVINELQFMADKTDKTKRDKGRRGLDILRDIRKMCGRKKFKIVDINSRPEDVDKSLVEFGKKYKTKIATVDFNLNKAAQVAGVGVLNINKLANEIKMNVMPGEIMFIRLVQNGKEDGQAVGYLEDGTMVVVRDGQKYIGEHKEVVIDKILQTDAGRMIFASIQQ